MPRRRQMYIPTCGQVHYSYWADVHVVCKCMHAMIEKHFPVQAARQRERQERCQSINVYACMWDESGFATFENLHVARRQLIERFQPKRRAISCRLSSRRTRLTSVQTRPMFMYSVSAVRGQHPKDMRAWIRFQLSSHKFIE